MISVFLVLTFGRLFGAAFVFAVPGEVCQFGDADQLTGQLCGCEVGVRCLPVVLRHGHHHASMGGGDFITNVKDREPLFDRVHAVCRASAARSTLSRW